MTPLTRDERIQYFLRPDAAGRTISALGLAAALVDAEAALDEARAEADDFRRAWAVMREWADGSPRTFTGDTAEDVARAFRDAYDLARADAQRARAERDEAREDVRKVSEEHDAETERRVKAEAEVDALRGIYDLVRHHMGANSNERNRMDALVAIDDVMDNGIAADGVRKLVAEVARLTAANEGLAVRVAQMREAILDIRLGTHRGQPCWCPSPTYPHRAGGNDHCETCVRLRALLGAEVVGHDPNGTPYTRADIDALASEIRDAIGHDRPDGARCNYIAGGAVCDKCGATGLPDLAATPPPSSEEKAR